MLKADIIAAIKERGMDVNTVLSLVKARIGLTSEVRDTY